VLGAYSTLIGEIQAQVAMENTERPNGCDFPNGRDINTWGQYVTANFNVAIEGGGIRPRLALPARTA